MYVCIIWQRNQQRNISGGSISIRRKRNQRKYGDGIIGVKRENDVMAAKSVSVIMCSAAWQ